MSAASVSRWIVRTASVVLILAPLVFVIWAWEKSGGAPQFKDGNETFLSYAHARNIVQYSPAVTMLLTFGDTAPTPQPGILYTHNPNGPRYVHAVLMLAGMTSLPPQVLTITVAATALAMLALLGLCRRLSPDDQLLFLTLGAAFVLDSAGFLTWTTNTYRTWGFVLLWGSLWAVAGPSRGWVLGAVAFAVWQYEYGFASFVSAAAFALALLLHGRRAIRPLACAAGGIVLSLALFAGQVVAFLGPSKMLADLFETGARRGDRSVMSDIPTRIVQVLLEQYSSWLMWMLFWSVLTSVVVVVVVLLRPGLGLDPAARSRVRLSQVQVSLTCGLLVFILFLPEFVMDGVLGSGMPCLGLLVAVAVASCALDLYLVLSLVLRSILPLVRLRPGNAVLLVVRVAAAVVALYPMALVYPRVFTAYPLIGGEVSRVLQTEFAGQPFLASHGFQYVPAALTGGPAFPSAPTIAPTDLDSPRVVVPTGPLYFLCLNRPWRNLFCDPVVADLTTRGHTLVKRGADYAILEVKR